MRYQKSEAGCSDVAEISLINPGDILFLYSDGVYDGSDKQDRHELEELMRAHSSLSARDICGAVLKYALGKDHRLLDRGDKDLIDDKTVFIIKRAEAF